MPSRKVTFEVPAAGARLDQALAEALPGVSRRRARTLVGGGAVFVEGKRCKIASRALQAGARVVVHLEEEAPPQLAVPGVIFEDERLLVIDKPPGIHVNLTETTAREALVEVLRQKGVHPVHRIDKDTSGVLLLAKDAETAAQLGAAFAERRVEKTYAAVVAGYVADGEIDQPIGPDRRRPRARAVTPGGKPARTRVTTLSTVDGVSAIRAEPVTGRTHQIRVHLAHAGAPLVGDTLYGGPAAVRLGAEVLRPGRALLHACRLVLVWAGERRAFEAPLPEDLARLVPLGLALDRVAG